MVPQELLSLEVMVHEETPAPERSYLLPKQTALGWNAVKMQFPWLGSIYCKIAGDIKGREFFISC